MSAFHVDAPSNNEAIQAMTPPSEYAIGAPSRPPSRTNNQSPLGSMVDFTGAQATGMPSPKRVLAARTNGMLGVSSSRSQEDEDMERALRESAQEAGLSVQLQESGVVDSSTTVQHFGPANRNCYDQDSWAMVPRSLPPNTTAHAVPAPSRRKRAQDAPAFLVQGSSAYGQRHCLGGILTLLHEIPMVRNEFLELSEPAVSYGHNGEWWNGEEILPPHLLAQMQLIQTAPSKMELAKIKVHEEIHRLMAFLDSTERSYGSIDSMVDILPSTDYQTVETAFLNFLKTEHPEQMESLYRLQTPVLFRSGDDLVMEDLNDCQGSRDITLINIPFVRAESDKIKTIYEAIDHELWCDALGHRLIDQSTLMSVLTDSGDIMGVRLEGEGPEDSIEVPLELYPERWLFTRKREAKLIQTGLVETQRAIDLVLGEREQLYELKDAVSLQTTDKRQMLKNSQEEWETYSAYLEGAGRFRAMAESGFDKHRYPTYRHASEEQDEEEDALREMAGSVVGWTEASLVDLQRRMAGKSPKLCVTLAMREFSKRRCRAPRGFGQATGAAEIFGQTAHRSKQISTRTHDLQEVFASRHLYT